MLLSNNQFFLSNQVKNGILTQNSHGFVIGDIVFFHGMSWLKTNTSNISTACVHGIVVRIVDENNFVIKSYGMIVNIYSGLTVGSQYYAQDTAGTYGLSPGTVKLPIFVALETNSIQLNIVQNYENLQLLSLYPYIKGNSINTSSITSTTFVDGDYLMYPGSNKWTPNFFRGYFARNGSGTSGQFDAQIFDRNSGLIICSASNSPNNNNQPNIVTTSTFSNLSSGAANWSIQYRKHPGSTGNWTFLGWELY